MSKMRDISMMYAAAAMFGGLGLETGESSINDKAIMGKLPEKPIPKGCKEYFFNNHGHFDTDRMLRTECVFKCYALNDKSAKRKYETWANSHKKEVAD